jgi:hypothetical protein
LAADAGAMSEKNHNSAAPSARMTRIAWLVCFVIPMLILALLAVAKPAAALTARAPGATQLLAPTLAAATEADAETSEEGSGEEADGSDEESEDEEEGEEEEFAPEECLLESASSRVVALPAQGKVHLTLRYSMLSPAGVAVDYRLAGKRGSLDLGTTRRRFGSQGVLQLTTHLSEAKMAKVLAARSFTVELDIPAAPHYCWRYYGMYLPDKHGGRSQLSWQE